MSFSSTSGGQMGTSLAQLQALLQVEGARGVTTSGSVDAALQPAIEIAAARESEYDDVAKVLSRVKNANLVKVTFSQPY